PGRERHHCDDFIEVCRVAALYGAAGARLDPLAVNEIAANLCCANRSGHGISLASRWARRRRTAFLRRLNVESCARKRQEVPQAGNQVSVEVPLQKLNRGI